MPHATRTRLLQQFESDGKEYRLLSNVRRPCGGCPAAKAALQDADLLDMPLHALRQSAAAAWLAGGNSMEYLQDQLGHGDIRTASATTGTGRAM